MKIISIIAVSMFTVIFINADNRPTDIGFDIEKVSKEKDSAIRNLMNEFNLNDRISKQIVYSGLLGYYCVNPKNEILTIIDYSKPSTEKRLFVLDIKNKKLLYECLVAHGKNTGENSAENFSNKPKSKKSSLGFFITAETYQGNNGYSLRLDGLEEDINHNARKRAIVIHGASYVSQLFINRHGRLGRSWGCPALPIELSKEIIDLIADGSCVFIYGDDTTYLTNSKFIKRTNNKN